MNDKRQVPLFVRESERVKIVKLRVCVFVYVGARVSAVVMQVYKKYDAKELCKLNTVRWNSIMNDCEAWKRQIWV